MPKVGYVKLDVEGFECRVLKGGPQEDFLHRIHPQFLQSEVAESQPWSVAEWAVARRFDIPRGTVLVLLSG